MVAAFPRTGSSNNLGAAIVLLNLEVNAFLGVGPRERDLADAESLRKAHDRMDGFVDAVAAKVRGGRG